MPEQPALLFPSTEEWGWTSWSEWKERIRTTAEDLGGLPPGTRVGFRFGPEPRSLTRDLAIQAAGAVAVPIPASGDLDLPVDRWFPGRTAQKEERPEAEGEVRVGSRSSGSLSRNRLDDPSPGVSVEEGGTWSFWGERELGIAAEVVGDLLIRDEAASGPDRELAYLSGCLRAPWERAYLAWCLETGAALVLAGDRELTGPGFLWSRPTMASLDAERLLEVEAALRSGVPLRRLRRRFRRLHTLLLWGPVDPAGLDRELWDRLGVRLARAPGSSPVS